MSLDLDAALAPGRVPPGTTFDLQVCMEERDRARAAVLALAEEVRRLRGMLALTSYIFVEGDARCGAVHHPTHAVCLLPRGHEGDHRNPSGYWMPREDEFFAALARVPAEEATE